MNNQSLKEHHNHAGGTSIFLKAVGRDKRPTWANRFVKDFYDLDYNRQNNIQKVAQSYRSPQKQQRTINKSAIYSKKNTISNHSQIIPKQRKSIQRLPYINFKTINPQMIMTSSKDVLGLCPFEYQNTIEGRIKKRSSLHLSFQKNKVNRIINQNPIYYNRSEDIDLSHSRLAQQRMAIDMHHPFGSYTQRKTFEPRDQLDKIFDTEQAFKAASPRRSPDAILKFDGVLQRKPSKLNQSVDLSYQYMPAIDQLKHKSISLPITTYHQRQLQIYPQIISERRGCYR